MKASKPMIARAHRGSSDSGCVGCVLHFIIGLIVGGLLFQYDMAIMFGYHANFIVCELFGIFLWPVALLAAIISWVAQFWVHAPLFHAGMLYLSTFRI